MVYSNKTSKMEHWGGLTAPRAKHFVFLGKKYKYYIKNIVSKDTGSGGKKTNNTKVYFTKNDDRTGNDLTTTVSAAAGKNAKPRPALTLTHIQPTSDINKKNVKLSNGTRMVLTIVEPLSGLPSIAFTTATAKEEKVGTMNTCWGAQGQQYTLLPGRGRSSKEWTITDKSDRKVIFDIGVAGAAIKIFHCTHDSNESYIIAIFNNKKYVKIGPEQINTNGSFKKTVKINPQQLSSSINMPTTKIIDLYVDSAGIKAIFAPS
jgi:hypothetical protein